MFTFHCEGNTNIVEISVDGPVTKYDFDRVAGLIESVIATHGSVRLIEIVRDLGRIEPAALWADLKFGPRHLKDFSHVAVVGHAKWLQWLTSMARPFMSAQVKYFDLADLEKARAWIHEGQNHEGQDQHGHNHATAYDASRGSSDIAEASTREHHDQQCVGD